MDIQSQNLSTHPLTKEETERYARFLYNHLEEYGDPLDDVLACFDYAAHRGGLLVTAVDDDELLGVGMTNETGMSGYIPANILVYLAVSPNARRRGVGSALMNAVKAETTGGIALHVEENNPAKSLYERSGFDVKYLEMRSA